MRKSLIGPGGLSRKQALIIKLAREMTRLQKRWHVLLKRKMRATNFY